MRKLAVLVSFVAATAFALPAAAAPFPSSVPLPVDFQPEGIAVGTGSTFYVDRCGTVTSTAAVCAAVPVTCSST